MALLFVLLMSSQATEQKVHEWLGVAMLLIALMHQYLNFWWYQSLLKMKRNAFYLFKNKVSVKRSFTLQIKKILFVILWCVIVYGLYLFLETQMLDYLLMRSQFAFLDYKMPLWQTVGKNMVMMISWIFMSLLLANFLQQQGNAK